MLGIMEILKYIHNKEKEEQEEPQTFYAPKSKYININH